MVASRPYREERAPRVLVSVAVIAVVALDALYVAIIRSQGSSDGTAVVPFVTAYLGGVAVALLASLFAPPWLKALLRGATSAGLLVMAVLTAFSIGVAVLVAAALSIAALVLTLARRRHPWSLPAAVAGGAVGVAVLAIGLQIAWSHITCPATGQSGGTVPSFVGSGASYECDNGVLTVIR